MAWPTGRGAPSAGLQVHQQPGAGVDLDHRAALGRAAACRCPRPPRRRRRCPGRRCAPPATPGGPPRGAPRRCSRWPRCRCAGSARAGRRPARCRASGPGAAGRRGSRRPRCEVDAAQRVVLGVAAARVGVDLRVDQRGHACAAVAGDPGRLAARGRDHLAADHQQPVLVAARRSARPCTSLPCRSATAQAASTSACVRRSSETPRPWLPSVGLTTTGRPMSCAASQASAGLAATWPSGTGTPTAPEQASWSGPCRWRCLRRWRWCRSVSAVQMRRWRRPWPSCTRLPSFSRMCGMRAVGGGGDDGRGAGAQVAVVDGLAHRGHGRPARRRARR